MQISNRKIIFFSLLVLFTALLPFNNSKAEQSIEAQIDSLVSRMTLRQKIGQLNQVNARVPDERLYNQIRNGEVGSILNAEDPVLLNKLQKNAVEESKLGIPIIFARDVIHGYKTIFPIPLGQAATFDRDVAEKGARIAAVEASEKGIRWTFAPMLDISRDPRWGRIAESLGEDTYLASEMGAAMVRGFQGNDLSNPTSVAACAKHFVGYGAVEGGRDYNVTYIPERQLRSVYLPPFEKSIKDAGCATVMTAFNANNGIPPSANKFLLTDLLRHEWKFDGVVVSDWGSVGNMVSHGFCEDKKEAALKAMNAGLDMEMVSGCYTEYLEELVNEGKVSEKSIDEAVRNILRLKLRLGLFKNPYVNLNIESKTYSDEYLQAARKAAEESFVLLKNNANTLPIGNNIKTVAVIGSLADAPHDQLGTWVFDGEKQKTQTPLQALKAQYGEKVKFIYEQTLTHSRDKNTSKFSAAIKAAQKADVVLLFIGEESILSGEAHSLANLDLVGVQSELLEVLKKTGTPIVTIIIAGRPLTIEKELNNSDALLYVWHPGTMGGPALADVLFGKSSPSGKLPVTFPRAVGQIPVYYNFEKLGRPARKNETLIDQIPVEAKQSSLGNTSYYLDAGFDPLFCFGYGLSYTIFKYENLQLSKSELSPNDILKVTANITNTGQREGCEIVQLYVSDKFASVAPMVKQLKNFTRISLLPGETKTVTFDLPIQQLAIWDIDMKHVVEAGDFEIMVGRNSNDGLKKEFRVQ